MEKENSKIEFVSNLLCAIFLALSPILTYIVFFIFMKLYDKYTLINMNLSIAMFGFGIGFLFQMILCMSGLLKSSFIVVIKRVYCFFDDLIISFGYSLKNYLRNIKEKGIFLWIYLDIIIVTLVIFVISVIKYAEIFI